MNFPSFRGNKSLVQYGIAILVDEDLNMNQPASNSQLVVEAEMNLGGEDQYGRLV